MMLPGIVSQRRLGAGAIRRAPIDRTSIRMPGAWPGSQLGEFLEVGGREENRSASWWAKDGGSVTL